MSFPGDFEVKTWFHVIKVLSASAPFLFRVQEIFWVTLDHPLIHYLTTGVPRLLRDGVLQTHLVPAHIHEAISLGLHNRADASGVDATV